MDTGATVAALLLERLKARDKPDLYNVATQIGLRVREVESKGFDGALVRATDAQKGVILVRSSIPETTRKRFTIAHEIGHFLLPMHHKLNNVCTGAEVESWSTLLQQAEYEANQFAAELILPTKLVRSALTFAEPSFREISLVAQRFEASLTATVRKYLDLTDFACAVVWNQEGQARWYHRSKAFPFYLTLVGLPRPESRAFRLFRGETVSRKFVQVSADHWLENKDSERVDSLLECSISLPNYQAVLTMLWIEHPSQDIPEDELLEELDPESFTLGRKKWPR